MSEEFILFEPSLGGWYGGQNNKYHDIFNLSSDKRFARKLSRYDAERLMKSLNGVGYTFEIEPATMTLDEAIAHCEEVASIKCDNCGTEHLQLAGWLKELKQIKERDKIQLTIKGQLRLVRDRCPDVWTILTENACTFEYSLPCIDEDCPDDVTKCKECWDKALEGDE